MKLYSSDYIDNVMSNAFINFISNVFSMCLYALLFGGIIYIGDFGLTTDKHFALSLILGFFAGLLNDIGRKIEFFNRDMLVERKPADKVEPKFKVGDVIRLKGSAATYTIKRVTDTTYYTDGWSCCIERCEEDYELVEQNTAEKQGKGTNGNNEEFPNSWSEEDKRKLDRIYSILGQAADTHAYSTTCRLIGDKECVELQDFLKGRVQPKPKQEWSEEDNNMFYSALWYIKNSCGNGDRNSAEFKVYEWFKSLKGRFAWEPSEEQMKQLG